MSTVEPAADAVLIPQPDRPKLPLRVPVEADLGSTVMKAEVEDRQVLTGRIAAHGVYGRFLVTLGERAIRRSKRFTVDLQGSVRIAQLPGCVDVRITDLSTGGARVEGVNLPIGTEIELRFTPPGRPSPINVLGFVVRAVKNGATPTIGVAFRLVQPSMDVLANTPLASVTA